MCILYHTHRLPCDVRPFLSLAKVSPTSNSNLPVTHVDPYSPPLSCSHRFNRNAPPHTACPNHGCCARTSIPLPCDCADTAPWGGIAPGSTAEDITRCPHYREFHRYLCVDSGPDGDEALDLYGDDDAVRGEKWPEYPMVDAWVAMPQARREPDRQPNFFCEGVQWKGAMEQLIESGRRLWAEVSRAEERRRWMEEEGEEEDMGLVGRAVAEAWEEARERQEALRRLHGGRAEAFLGFGREEEGEGRGGEFPGGRDFV